MPPIPQRVKKKSERPTRIGFSQVYNDMGVSLEEYTAKERRKQRRDQRNTSDSIKEVRENTGKQSTDYNGGGENELLTVTFTNVMPGKKYRITVTDLAWFSTGSYIDIGYMEGDTFTSLVHIDTTPEYPYFEVEIPDSSEADAIRVKINGISKTSVYLQDITETEATVHYDKEQNLQDSQKQRARENITAMIDILDSGVGLSPAQVGVILEKLGLDELAQTLSDIRDELADHEGRISALENPT